MMLYLRLFLFLMSATIAEAGTASWYGKAHHGKRTASGEKFNMHALTAASWKLPFGSVVKVTNTANGRSVLVRINDRGPALKLKREIDLSMAAFARIADLDTGLINVKVEKVK